MKMKYDEKIKWLKYQANEVRKDIVTMIYHAGSGHPGGSLSSVEILTVLYLDIMDLTLDENNKRKDKFILSKGHCAPVYYSLLSRCGFIPRKDLVTLRKYDSYLEGHPSNKICGVDVSSGSLGQGLSVANGMALAKKLSNQSGRVYCLVGDGEIEEGQFFEALMTTNKYNLNNLVLIIDNNDLQIDGSIDEVKKASSIAKKIEAFEFNIININGNDIEEVLNSLEQSKNAIKPTCIIADTIKGKGISFMENRVEWHGRSLKQEEYEQAIKELEMRDDI